MLLRKPRVYAEVYNDLDDVVVNLFRVLRDESKAARLIAALRLTPFARAEFTDALEPPEDDVERARHLIVRSLMGFGSAAHSSSPVAEKTAFKTFTRPSEQDTYRSTGFRSNCSRRLSRASRSRAGSSLGATLTRGAGSAAAAVAGAICPSVSPTSASAS